MMISKRQSELSALEVCLRSLDYLPSVPVDDYIIQPYRGGTNHLIQSRSLTLNQKPESYLKLITQTLKLKKAPIIKVTQIPGNFIFIKNMFTRQPDAQVLID